MPRLTKEKIKNKLNYHYRAFDRTTISPDPLEFPHRFKSPPDIEVAAFIASVFAYGSVTQILNTRKYSSYILKKRWQLKYYKRTF